MLGLVGLSPASSDTAKIGGPNKLMQIKNVRV
jgi:hypothetical protein